MRARDCILALFALAAAATAVHAQTPAPTATPSGADAPAAPTQTAVPADPSLPPAPSTTAAPAAEPAPQAGAPAAGEDEATRAARIMRERAAMQVMLARAREAHRSAGAGSRAEEREPAREYGDAGAPFALGLSFDAPWYSDPGYDVYAEDDAAARFGLWVGYDVASLSDDMIAAVELGWGHENEEGEALRVADTRLTTNVLYGGVTVRWVPISWLQPHARLAGGAALVDGELRAADTFHEGGDGLFEDLISPYGSAGLGFTVRTPTRTFESRKGRLASLSFGLMLEGGYTLAAPLELELEGPRPRAPTRPVAAPGPGELERSGPYIRVSLVGRL